LVKTLSGLETPMGRVTRILHATTRPATDQAHGRADKPDHDLARVVSAWPSLPRHIRRSILTLIAAASAREE
jgi:hypothetical protein